MKVTNFEFVGHFCPKMSCGTGYSEWDKFIVTLENGYKKTVNIDTWYMSDEKIPGAVYKQLNEQLIFDMGDHIEQVMVDNFDEVFEWYKKTKNH